MKNFYNLDYMDHLFRNGTGHKTCGQQDPVDLSAWKWKKQDLQLKKLQDFNMIS